MKKQILMMAMILASAVYVNAQDKKHDKSPEERADKIVERLTVKLSLSKDQSVKMENVFLDAGKKIEAAKAKHGEDKPGFRIERKRIFEEKEAVIKQILNAEQFSTYLAWKEEQKAKHKEKRQQKKG